MLGYIHAGNSPKLSSYEVIAMEANLKRITLDLDPDTERRLMATAALRGMSLHQYCHAAIDRELASAEILHRPVALSRATFGNVKLPGDSTEFIREARTARSGP